VQQHPVNPLPKGPVDPDVDLRIDGRAGRAHDPLVLGAIAAGGAIGASARYLIGLGWPTPAGGFPISTLIINVVGCGLIGILMVLVSDVFTRQRLLRPFLGNPNLPFHWFRLRESNFFEAVSAAARHVLGG